MNATDTACGAAIEGSSIRFLCDDSGTADAVPLSEKEKDDENTKSSMAQKAQMLSDWGQSSAAGLFDNVGSLVSHMRRVGRSGKLARRNSTSLIDGKEQKVAGAIYECVMNDDWKASKRWFGQCNNITYFILDICDALTRECMT